jgi:hypothetical protein
LRDPAEKNSAMMLSGSLTGPEPQHVASCDQAVTAR